MKRYAAATFALLAASMSASAGCELVSRVDRSQVNQTGGAGGDGGSGGTGGLGPCTTAADCPGADTACRTRTCTAGLCGEVLAPMGTASDTQMPGDCQRAICDGQGMVTLEPDNTDILDDQNDCTEDVCNAGQPENNPLLSGDTCMSSGGKVCDGAGECVQCVAAADCASKICTSNLCVPASCADETKNDTETDVDCGGGTCAPCAPGLTCLVDTDCDSGVCNDETSVCEAPTCGDDAENGEETDVDCGGPTCAPCGPGLDCAVDADCAGGSCSGSVCLPTCTDDTKNSNETDVDCGGPTCAPCGPGLDCSVDTDCASDVCTQGACQAANCMDAVLNGTETSVDCGGGACQPCAAGETCTGATDCQSNICTDNVCQMGSCTDNVKNGTESDVDCGGGACPPCELGEACLVGVDCTSQVCGGNVCVVEVCGDGLVTGVETCDDGNGMAGDGCSDACSIESGWLCTGMPDVCTPVCGDGVLTGPETCDDANATAGDGCSDTCEAELGYTCTGLPSVCTTTCGDGVPAGAEPCDDGNLEDNDGCLPGCIAATCGDGYVNAGIEGCDDGNTTPGDGCNGTCKVEPFYVCFDVPSTCTLIEVEPNACDSATGPLLPPFTITGKISPVGDQDHYSFIVPAVADVRIETFSPSLGICTGVDNVIELYTLNSSCATTIVTDDQDGIDSCAKIDAAIDTGVRKLAPGTYVVRVEDWLNNAIISAYQLQVSFIALCGDGVVSGTETCDDGNTASSDGCSSSCLIETGYGCGGTPSLCATVACGNGVVDGTDSCDDGNTVSGDGCSSTCVLEPNYRCKGAPGVCTRVETYCGDGADNDGDGLVDANDPECVIPSYFPACAANERLVVVRSQDTPFEPLDGYTTGYTSILPMAPVGTVKRATLLLNVTHQNIGEIDVWLTAPTGAELDMTTDNGAANDNYTNTLLDTTCATAVTAGTAPYSGCFKPEIALTPINNTAPQGLWKLRIADDTNLSAGTLDNWAVILCTTP